MSNTRDPWSPWYPARFDSEEERDRFLRAVAGLGVGVFEATPMPDEARAAWVRWRSGRFVVINDIAHAHAGRIRVSAKRNLW